MIEQIGAGFSLPKVKSSATSNPATGPDPDPTTSHGGRAVIARDQIPALITPPADPEAYLALAATRVTGSPLRVLSALLELADSDQPVGARTIADRTGLCRRDVQRRLAKLEKRGLLTVTYLTGPGGNRIGTAYVLEAQELEDGGAEQ